jgi:hypothetical protein
MKTRETIKKSRGLSQGPTGPTLESTNQDNYMASVMKMRTSFSQPSLFIEEEDEE